MDRKAGFWKQRRRSDAIVNAIAIFTDGKVSCYQHRQSFGADKTPSGYVWHGARYGAPSSPKLKSGMWL